MQTQEGIDLNKTEEEEKRGKNSNEEHHSKEEIKMKERKI